MKILELTAINLQLFAGNTNVTTDSGMSPEIKTYYSDYLIDMADPKLVHTQFGQKHSIPKNGGKSIEFRKYSPLPKLTTPITEGVTPDGQKLNTSIVTATLAQYGGYVELSDFLIMTSIDNNLVQATKLLGSQMGRTLDTLAREELCGGTNVQYAGNKTARYKLVGGESSGNDYMNVDTVKRAVRTLKKMNAETFDGYYVAIINQDCAFDLTNDPEWKYPHQYKDTVNLYSGEIGAIAGCRFVETSEAKVFHAENLTAEARNLTVSAAVTASASVSVAEKIESADAAALVGRKIIAGDKILTIASATAGTAGSASLTLSAAATITDGTVLYPGEAGAKGRDVYATIVLGENAYGTVGISGDSVEHIIKQLGSAGSADALNQRATAGWKATTATKRLVEDYMVRIESTSTFNDVGVN